MSELDTDKARQGRKGTRVLVILIAALILCIVAFFGMGLYGWVMPDTSNMQTEGEATTNAPADNLSPGGSVVTPEESERQDPAASPQ